MSDNTSSIEKTFAITGIPVEAGAPIPTRQEISAWSNDPKNKYGLSLFLRALTAFQELDVTEKLSYFQIAGIHSYPLVPWDGETQQPKRKLDPYEGFCAHNRVTFPTWHRPYMLLFEQVLWLNMKDIIGAWVSNGKLTDQSEENVWYKAADQFRLPYWDWARVQPYAKKFGVPHICTLETVDIITPGGGTENFPNPLVRFRNPTLNSKGQRAAMGDKDAMGKNAIKDDDPNKPDAKVKTDFNILPWSKCIGTSRYGILEDGDDYTNGINNWKACNDGLSNVGWYSGPKGYGGHLSDAVNRLLRPNYSKSWGRFASTICHDGQSTKDYLSLEYIHNVVHNMSGGQFMSDKDIEKGKSGYLGLGLGHMSDVPVAAFDPIFWLHHCNIDRLLAIWQKLNPKKWFDDPKGDDPGPDCALLPFHYESGDPSQTRYTSTMSRYCKDLHYQYDDLVPKNGIIEDSLAYRKELYKQVQSLYPNTVSTLKKVPGLDTTFNDYVINVIYDRYALSGLAYSILFFIGEPPTSISGYATSPNYVGSVYTFSSPLTASDVSSSCANCSAQQKAKVRSTAHIPVTVPLLAKLAQLNGPSSFDSGLELPVGGLQDYGSFLAKDKVTALLQDPKEGLHWVFVTLGGQKLPAENFPDTLVAVMKGEARHENDAEGFDEDGNPLTVYGRYKVVGNATKGKKLGYGFEGVGLPDDLIKDDPIDE